MRGRSCASFYRDVTKPGSGKFYQLIVSRETGGSLGAGELFHVKQLAKEMNKEILFTYTKLPEDDIEDIFHIYPAEQPAQGMSCDPKMLGSEFLALPQDL
jgi:hypothetical protein